MNIYEKNLKTLTKYYPRIDELIEDAKINLKPELEVIEDYADNKEIILKVKKDGKTFYLNGKRNTQEPAQIWVDSLGELQSNAPIFMMGIGNPTYLQRLVNQVEKKIVIVI